ncbi:MAG: helix-turn-helix transcriptional regulator [Flavobacteriales bacterium]|nr:helix-turn-helix transcriptional regulator [Flavobacteriales bacterium]
MDRRATKAGLKLAAARKAQGLTQRVVASACGLTVNRLSRIENGKAVLMLGEAIRLVAFLGMNLGQLSRYPPPRNEGVFQRQPRAQA